MKVAYSHLAVLIAGTVLICPNNIYAQIVDYGSLQSLFKEAITMSATGSPQRTRDVPANMTIITADEIRQSGSRSIPQIIGEYVSGIDVMQSGIDSYDIGVRGYNQGFQPRLLVLLNGRQVFLDDYSRTDWNAIPVNIDNIRQIEVVKGPNAALFGNNAVGGAINIVTYNALYDKNNVANVTVGTQSTREAEATITQKAGNWGGIQLSAGGVNNNEFSANRTPFDQSLTVNDPKRRYVVADSIFQVAPDVETELEATYTKSQASGAGIQGIYSHSLQEISSLKGAIAGKTDYGLITATSYWNHVDTDFEFSPVEPLPLTNDLYVAQLQDMFRLGTSHIFRIAGEYQINQFDLNAVQAIAQHPQIGYNTLSESAMWDWAINPQWELTNAIRVDERQEGQSGTLASGGNFSHGDYNQYTTGVNVNSGLVFKMTDIDTFHLTYGRGLQYPSYYESGIIAAIPFEGVIVNFQNDPRLKPTIVTNYEFDYDREIKPISSSIRGSVFYTGNRDLKSFDTEIFPPVFPVVVNVTSINIGDSHAVGFEWDLNGKSDGWRWGASYSFSNVVDSSEVESLFHYAKSAPKNSVKLHAGYSWRKWEFDGSGIYVSTRNTLREPDGNGPAIDWLTGSYAAFSGRIGYALNDNVTLALSGLGLNRQSIDVAGYANIDRQVLLGLTGKF